MFEHILETPNFWLWISFTLFAIFIGRPVIRFILTNIDSQSNLIATQLKEAKIAHQQAESLFQRAKMQRRMASIKAETILKNANIEKERLILETTKKLDEILKREEKKAIENIKRLETQSAKRIQEKATQTSLNTAKNILITLMSEKKYQESLNQKIINNIKKI